MNDEILDLSINYLSILANEVKDIDSYFKAKSDTFTSPEVIEILCCATEVYPQLLELDETSYFELFSVEDKNKCINNIESLGNYLSSVRFSAALLKYGASSLCKSTYEKDYNAFLDIYFPEEKQIKSFADLYCLLIESSFAPFTIEAFYYSPCWKEIRRTSKNILNILELPIGLPMRSVDDLCSELRYE